MDSLRDAKTYTKRKEMKVPMLKTNVVKKPFKVLVDGQDADCVRFLSWTEVWAESEETARLQIPEGYEILEIQEVKDDE